MMSEESVKKQPPIIKYGGGPHGLGDPYDNTLRKVEIDVLIPKIIRDRAREEKCTKEVAEFTQCCKDAGLIMIVSCRKENAALKECLQYWYNNEQFREECKQQYLTQRSEYRKTGITQKQLQHNIRLQSN